MHCLQTAISGISAGIVILIGCGVYLACDVSYIGALLFSVALLCICLKGYALFTGRVGYLAERHGKREARDLLLALLGNALGVCALGMALGWALPNLAERARAICALKQTQTPGQTFVRGVFCGVTMYLAVSVYRERKSVLAILFCVPSFILSGFEHSIADMGYFAIAGMVSGRAFGFIGMVLLGNAAGGLLLPALNRVGSGKRAGESSDRARRSKNP